MFIFLSLKREYIVKSICHILSQIKAVQTSNLLRSSEFDQYRTMSNGTSPIVLSNHNYSKGIHPRLCVLHKWTHYDGKQEFYPFGISQIQCF